MSKIVRILLLLALLASMLSLLPILGCKDEEGTPEATEPSPTTPGLSQQELQQILADSMLSTKTVNSYRFNMDMDMVTETIGGNEPGKMSAIMTASGTSSQDPLEMQMIMDMSMDMPAYLSGYEAAETPQSMSMEMYLVGEWMYMKMAIPQLGEQWMKMALSEEMMEQYNMNLVDQQLEPLLAVIDIEFLRYETYDGSECYVLNVVPDMKAILQWVGQQQTVGKELDWEEMAGLADLFKEFSYILWIEKDTNLIRKMNIDMLMEISPEQSGVTTDEFQQMNMDISMEMTMYDHNKPVSIILPDEAKDAIEMPQFGGMTED